MRILVVGLSYRQAAVELRERLAIREEDLPAALRRLRGYVSEGVILSTCNRTEVYALVAHRESGPQCVRRFLTDWHQGAISDQAIPYYEYWQDEAIRHLFRVASGLDSQIIGEPQILGQVKRAYEQALAQESVGRVLSRLFQQAIALGKRARSQTGISRSATSLAYAAVEVTRRVFDSVESARLLVVGAGEMGKLAAVAMVGQGARQVAVASRRAEMAERLASLTGGIAVSFDDLGEQLAHADVVVSSTSAPEHVITLSMVERAAARRGDRPLVLIDLAVPRDVDPAASALAGIHLFNIDDLHQLCGANLRGRQTEAAKVEVMIEEEIPRFMRWWDNQDVVPTITALVDKVEAIRQAELAKTLPRLTSLSERDRQAIEALTAAIVSKMLHHPISRLKERSEERDGRHYVPAVRDLFQLEDQP